MEFTLIATCRNEIDSLPKWREDLRVQTRQPDEIVIVDSESDDGTRNALLEWARDDPRVRVRIERCTVARGRNIAIEMATNGHIVSTDMGVRLDRRWFEEIVRPFEQDPTVQVVAGSYEIDSTTLRSAAARAEYYLENGGRPNVGPGFLPGGRSSAYTKEVHARLGGWPEDLTMCADDWVFGRQVLWSGIHIAYAPEAIVYWARPASLREFWREKRRYGFGDGEALVKTPCAYRLHRQGLLPAFLVPLLTGLRTLTGTTKLVKGLGRGLSRGDLMACLSMPLLLFGNGWSFGRGYVLGALRGETHCTQCRARLRHTPDSLLSRI